MLISYVILREMQLNSDLRMKPEQRDVKLSSTIDRLIITIFFTIGTFFVVNYYWPREWIRLMGGLESLVYHTDNYQSLTISIGFILVLFLSIFTIVFIVEKAWDWIKSRRESA